MQLQREARAAGRGLWDAAACDAPWTAVQESRPGAAKDSSEPVSTIEGTSVAPVVGHRKPLAALFLTALFFTLGPPTVAASTVDKSDNIRLVGSLPPYSYGAELAFQGNIGLAAEIDEGATGLHILDASGKSPKEIGFYRCAKTHAGSEVEPLRKGYVAYYAGAECGGAKAGIHIIDVRAPRRPRVVAVVDPPVPVHTLTVVPGTSIIYVSPNSVIPRVADRGAEGIVDATDPLNPKTRTFPTNGESCHDVSLLMSKQHRLGACASSHETQLWDVSDPLAPKVIARIPTPQVFYNHAAAFSDDGKVLVVGDEAWAVSACTGASTYGSLWFYDISVPQAPILVGSYNNPHGDDVSSAFGLPTGAWCTAHMYDFLRGTRYLAIGWYAGGLSVLDLSDPSRPKEVAHYFGGGLSPWVALWHRGRIWTSSYSGNHSVDVFELDLAPRTARLNQAILPRAATTFSDT